MIATKKDFLRVDGDDFSAFVKYDPVLNSREEVRYAQSLYVATVSSSKCYISPELSDAGWRIIVYDWGGKEGGAREGLRGHDQRIVLPEYIPSRLDPFLWLSGALHEIGHAYDFAEMSESERSSIDDEYSLFHELVSLLPKRNAQGEVSDDPEERTRRFCAGSGVIPEHFPSILEREIAAHSWAVQELRYHGLYEQHSQFIANDTLTAILSYVEPMVDLLSAKRVVVKRTVETVPLKRRELLGIEDEHSSQELVALHDCLVSRMSSWFEETFQDVLEKERSGGMNRV